METREKILEAALWLLEHEDLSKTRMGDIAKKTGISRQAVYLHFKSRTELLVAAVRYGDEKQDADSFFVGSRASKGADRIDAFIRDWSHYVQVVYPVARALMAHEGKDEAALEARKNRMAAVRHGCAAAVDAAIETGELRQGLDREDAIDFLLALLWIRTWEQLTVEGGWGRAQYETHMIHAARGFLLA